MPPIEPPPTSWDLAAARPTRGDDLVAVGADLEPGTLLAAYRHGLFPMGLGGWGSEPMGWWSPDPRGVLEPEKLRVSRSLRRSLRSFTLTWDMAFPDVVAACADPRRPGRWITPEIRAAYGRLFALGWAHSVEVWREDRLVGGLYGVAVGGLFAGESMFHLLSDASKVALVGLATVLTEEPDPRRFIDVQWQTDHLASLGTHAESREIYLRRLAPALGAPDLRRGPGTVPRP